MTVTYSRLFFSLVIALQLAECCVAKNWHDKVDNQSFEGTLSGAIVVIQLEGGLRKKIPFGRLSEEDQQFVLESLKRDFLEMERDDKQHANNGAAIGLHRKLNNAEREAVQLAAINKLDEILNTRSSGNLYSNLASVLPGIVAQKNTTARLAELLRPLEERMSIRIQNADVSVPRYWQGFVEGYDAQFEQVRGEIIRILADIAGMDESVKKHFQEVAQKLRNSPSPGERIQSAFRLYRAEGVSEIALPVLISTFSSSQNGVFV